MSTRVMGDEPLPTTRRDRNEWFLTGWAISLRTAPIGTDVPEHLAWVVPGWVRGLRLNDLQPLPFPGSLGPGRASTTVRALARLTPTLLERLAPEPVRLDVPPLLLPALFLSGSWPLEPGHLAALAGSWEEEQLASHAGRLPAERRQELAMLLWDLTDKAIGVDVPTPVAERLAFLRPQHHSLLRFVADNLPPAVIRATAREAGTHRRYGQGGASFTTTDPEALGELSPTSRTAAVRGWLEMTPKRPRRFDEARELVRILDRGDLELVLDVVRAADGEVAAEFATRAWRAIPERALEEARTPYEERLASAEGWFALAPRAQLGHLVGAVRASSPVAAWVPAWAFRRLLDAGPHAEELFQLAASTRPMPPGGAASRRSRRGARAGD